MKSYAFLQYSFIFDPSEAWAHVYQFEKDLAEFFTSKGFDAQVMKQIEGTQGSTKVLILKKIDGAVMPTETKPGRPVTFKGHLNKVRATKTSAPARDFKKGQFLPRKGYLKK
jgi:hypothetical protein